MSSRTGLEILDLMIPLGIISGLKEIFIKRHIVEMTNEAKIRPDDHIEKTESGRENLWNEIQLKGP